MALTNDAMNDLCVEIRKLVISLDENLRTMKSRYDTDSTVYSAQSVRADVTSGELAAAMAAIGELLFTLDSGSPTQKSKLYELL